MDSKIRRNLILGWQDTNVEDKIKLKVVQQGARGSYFYQRPDGSCSTSFIWKNDTKNTTIVLKSSGGPSVSSSNISNKLFLYVRGTEPHRDEHSVLVFKRWLPWIEQAILAYNQQYSNNTQLDVDDVVYELKEN